MCEIIRNESVDLAEDVELIDAFYNPKKDRQSLAIVSPIAVTSGTC